MYANLSFLQVNVKNIRRVLKYRNRQNWKQVQVCDEICRNGRETLQVACKIEQERLYKLHITQRLNLLCILSTYLF